MSRPSSPRLRSRAVGVLSEGLGSLAYFDRAKGSRRAWLVAGRAFLSTDTARSRGTREVLSRRVRAHIVRVPVEQRIRILHFKRQGACPDRKVNSTAPCEFSRRDIGGAQTTDRSR